MRTFKLLIADPSVDFCRKLADALGDGPELRVCHDGQKARELLEQFRPDVLVMDLILPHQDGVCLLRAAQTLEKRPICVVATSLVNHYVETVIRSFDVDYLMQKPCDIPSLAERVFELTESGEAAIFVPPTAENRVRNLLLSLGMTANSRRFWCVEEAMACYLDNPHQSVTKELYPAVAKKTGVSAQAVEKAIRTEITRAWSCRNDTIWRTYFHWDRCGTIPRPTNATFFAQLALHLAQQCVKIV